MNCITIFLLTIDRAVFLRPTLLIKSGDNNQVIKLNSEFGIKLNIKIILSTAPVLHIIVLNIMLLNFNRKHESQSPELNIERSGIVSVDTTFLFSC